jgi:tungstate transport system substrate-binding protein
MNVRRSNRPHLVGIVAVAILVLLAVACSKDKADSAGKEVVLLTTTTTQDSGILTALVDAFERNTQYRVKPIVAGSGDVLKQASRGEGDVVLTHSPEAEKEWMKQGYAASRRLVMYNDFIFIGPPADPAQIKGMPAASALKKIFDAKAPFVSRGDQSGTHSREVKLWKQAGVDPKAEPWYRETGQGQGQTMDVASQQQAYAFTDRGTFLVHQKRLGLVMLGDPALRNIYHVMTVDPAKFPKVNAQGGTAFADFLVSPDGQRVITEFGKEIYGTSLFTPAAGKNEEELLGSAGK